MRCSDVSVSACSQRPLCPCMRAWDRQMAPSELKVAAQSQAEAAAGLVVVSTLLALEAAELLAARLKRFCRVYVVQSLARDCERECRKP